MEGVGEMNPGIENVAEEAGEKNQSPRPPGTERGRSHHGKEAADGGVADEVLDIGVQEESGEGTPPLVIVEDGVA